MLIDTNDSVLDIGFRVGFGNYSNFNRQFKRIKGFGPRTLRRQFLPQPPGGNLRYAHGPLPAASINGRDGKINTRAAQRS
jgi:AraC-like DNA-binding protein